MSLKPARMTPTATTIIPPNLMVMRCSKSRRSALVASCDTASAIASAISPACCGGNPADSNRRASFSVSNGIAMTEAISCSRPALYLRGAGSALPEWSRRPTPRRKVPADGESRGRPWCSACRPRERAGFRPSRRRTLRAPHRRRDYGLRRAIIPSPARLCRPADPASDDVTAPAIRSAAGLGRWHQVKGGRLPARQGRAEADCVGLDDRFSLFWLRPENGGHSRLQDPGLLACVLGARATE